jgi:polysaccharide export outer membrane protein
VKAWREPQYSDDGLSVDASGEIVLPRVGPLRVTGLTIGTLQDSVRARYAAYLRDPVVTVTVLRRVGLQGEVRAPGLYYVDPTTTLRDVIAQGGGLTEAANASRVEIVREGRLVPVAGAARDRASLAELRSGDAIIVGRRSWLSRNALAVVSTLGLVVSVGVQVFRR